MIADLPKQLEEQLFKKLENVKKETQKEKIMSSVWM